MAGTKISAGTPIVSFTGTDIFPLYRTGQSASSKFVGTIALLRGVIAEPVSAPTYQFTNADNGKLKVFTETCTATIPAGLDDDWSCLGWRDVGAGVTTIVSDGSLKSIGNTIDLENTEFSIIHVGGDVHYLAGGVGTLDAVTSVTLTQPAAGITITDSGNPITSTGTRTFALANDLAALEGLSTTGIARRTGTSTWTAGGVVTLAEGGTGVGLVDPGGHRLMGWDDTDNAVSFITIGTGLTYTQATHTLSSSGSGWATSGDTPLTGATSITGSTTNTLQFIMPINAATRTEGAGLWLNNTTAATVGAQKISPSLVLTGNGWKTTATAGTQKVEFALDVLPVQGSTNPTGLLQFSHSVNDAAYSTIMTLSTINSILQLTAGSAVWTVDPSSGWQDFQASGQSYSIRTGGSNRVSWTQNGDQTHAFTATATGARTALLFTSPANTNQTTATEIPSVNFNLSATTQWATGTITTQRTFRIQAQTIGFVGSSTVTTASTLAISGPPIAGTNATITTGYALNIESGNMFTLGKHVFDATITTGGTTGNQTINKPSGTVNIAAAGTTVTVTNSFCTTSSIVYAVIRTNDTTATIKNVVPGSGSFVINLGGAAAAEISVGFMVFN